mgnify:CR=1 FL=1
MMRTIMWIVGGWIGLSLLFGAVWACAFGRVFSLGSRHQACREQVVETLRKKIY